MSIRLNFEKLQLVRSKDEKWILQKNISSKELFLSFIKALKNIGNYKLNGSIKINLKRMGLYKGRSKEGSNSTMGVRFSELCFYMFGYKKNNQFIPSATSQLYDKPNVNNALLSLISFFSLQYPSPYSNTSSVFNIYIGRLIVKLLLEERIQKRLYIDEIIWFLPFVRRIDEMSYELLINDIITYRTLSYEEKRIKFIKIKNYEDVFANAIHEINYYFLRIFNEFEVLDLVPDKNHNGSKLFKFKHGNTSTFRSDAIKSGAKYSGYVRLNKMICSGAEILSNKYSAFDIPLNQGDYDCKEDWIRDLYEFQMLKYIDDIINNKDFIKDISSVVQTMVYESRYGTNDGKSFEFSLKPVFELFRENRNVEIISGSGDTDLLCLMLYNNDTSNKYKVNVDAKKTKKRLNIISTTRINHHLEMNKSKYCIVVSPKFSKGAKLDIRNNNIVTIEAETLANYCLKECLASCDGKANYQQINDVIENNLGCDITENINDIIVSNYTI